MFGAGDDAGGSIGGVVGSACVHQWYVSRGGAGTTCGTSRETSLTVEEKKGSLKECNISNLSRGGSNPEKYSLETWKRVYFYLECDHGQNMYFRRHGGEQNEGPV